MNVDYLVIGAGVAGFSAASRLKELDPGSTVALVDGEDFLPYKRTRLSKDLALGLDPAAMALEPAGWYAGSGVELVAGQMAADLDPAAHTVHLASGTVLTYRRVLLALGVRPAIPAGIPAATICHGFWSLSDALTLRTAWDGLEEVCILGSGVLALELADQALRLGKKVRILARSPLPLLADLGPHAASLIRQAAESRGVVWDGLPRTPPDWPGHLSLACGTVANLELARAAGISCARGIEVDRALRTSAPGVWAAGDCAELPDGRMSHLWHESEAMGRYAAESMVLDLRGQVRGTVESGESCQEKPGAGTSGSGAVHASRLPLYRMKAEVFGQYLWTMGYRELSGTAGLPGDLEVLQETRQSENVGSGQTATGPGSGPHSRSLVFREGRLLAAAVLNDKDRNKTWEQAVRESWTREELLTRLPLQ